MVVSSTSTLSTDIWDSIRGIIAADSVVKVGGTAGIIYIGGPYPSKFIDSAGGLPFIVIHKPVVIEEKRTITKKAYLISIEIESFADNAATLKLVSDGVRNALESNESTTRASNFMFNFKVVGDTEDFDLRRNKRIHRNMLTCEYLISGA